MKSTIRLLNLSVSLFALAIFASGCYTQLATTRDEDQTSDRPGYEASRSYNDADTVAARGISDFDEDVRGQYRAGFDFYYPSAWYWGAGFYGDPIYNLYGYPGYYGYPYNYYGYGYPGYGYGYGYYGGFNPYYGYNGYPFVTYAPGGTRYSQTRNAGYRRSGLNRTDGYSGGLRASVSSSLGVSPASRRSSSPGGTTVAPANRRSGTQINRGTARSSVSGSPSRARSFAAPSGSSTPSARSTPSGGSRAPSSSAPRSSGTTRSRGYSDSPASGTNQNGGGSSRVGSPSPSSSGSSRGSSPSYTPAPASSSPARSSSPPPSSGGSSGGSGGDNRSSGASRTGRN
jgi:hypothetical protein